LLLLVLFINAINMNWSLSSSFNSRSTPSPF